LGHLGAPPAVSADAAGATSVRGRVLLGDGTPARGVTVISINLESRQVSQSAPTDEAGEYRIDGLIMGYYDFAVDFNGKLYLADGVLPVQGSQRVSFTLDTVVPEQREWWQSGATKRIEALNRVPEGTARLTSEGGSTATGGGRRTKIAWIAAGGAAAAALALGGSSGSGSSSPSTP